MYIFRYVCIDIYTKTYKKYISIFPMLSCGKDIHGHKMLWRYYGCAIQNSAFSTSTFHIFVLGIYEKYI